MSDGGSFESWYRREHPRLFVAMTALIGDADIAADVADEALARALAHWRRVSEMESPSGWTYRVAMNVWRRRMRRERLERRLLFRLPQRPTVGAPAGEVWHLVRDLPRRQRQVVVLRYVADLTEPDIGRVLNLGRGTVASTLAAARDALRATLTEPDSLEETT